MPSTVVANMEYNAVNQELDIYFKTGTVYRYQKVPASVVDKMKQAFSKGKFFNEHIKNIFHYTRIDKSGYLK